MAVVVTPATEPIESIDDDELLAEREGMGGGSEITELRHVRTAADKRAAEEIANRTSCEDFDNFKPLFVRVKKDLDVGIRQARRFQTMAEIKEGEFFIVGGQIAYVAGVGKEFVTKYDPRDSRLRVIYDNGTESDVLLRSLQRALRRLGTVFDLGRQTLGQLRCRREPISTRSRQPRFGAGQGWRGYAWVRVCSVVGWTRLARNSFLNREKWLC